MQNQRSGILPILIFLIFSGIISWYFGFKEYQQQDTVSVHDFPRSLAGWESEELTITAEEYAILETKNVFARKYKKGGMEVDLLLVYSQTNRKVSHPPELCYTGSGLTILNKQDVTLNIPSLKMSILAKKLVMEKGNFRELSIYWFKGGSAFTSNYWKQQAVVALNTLRNKPSSSALIRISTVIPKNEDNSGLPEKTIRDFAESAAPAIMQYLP